MVLSLFNRIAQMAVLLAFNRSALDGHALERKRRAALTIGTNFVARIASFGFFALASRFAIEGMGTIHFGIWMTIAGLMVFISLFDFGIGNGLVGPIARCCQDTEKDEQARLITIGLAATSLIGIILSICLSLIVSIIPLDWLFRGIAAGDIGEARNALLIFAILVGASLPLQTTNRIFFAMQRAYVTHILSIVASFVMASILLFIPSATLTIGDYVLMTFGAIQIPSLIALGMLAAERKVRTSALRNTRMVEYRALFNVGAAFLALQVGTLIGWGSDQILVSALRGPAEAGSLAITSRIFMLVSVPFIIVNGPLWPIYATEIQRGEMQTVKVYLRLSLIGTLFGAITLSAAVLMAGPFIWDLFSGGNILYPSLLMIGFGLWTVIDCTGNALGTFLNAAQIIRAQLITVSVFVVASIPAKTYMIGRYDIWTIPFTTSAIYLLTFVGVYTFYLRHSILRALSVKT